MCLRRKSSISGSWLILFYLRDITVGSPFMVASQNNRWIPIHFFVAQVHVKWTAVSHFVWLFLVNATLSVIWGCQGQMITLIGCWLANQRNESDNRWSYEGIRGRQTLFFFYPFSNLFTFYGTYIDNAYMLRYHKRYHVMKTKFGQIKRQLGISSKITVLLLFD